MKKESTREQSLRDKLDAYYKGNTAQRAKLKKTEVIADLEFLIVENFRLHMIARQEARNVNKRSI